jgi:putative GTP pyrophosphokinase
LPHLNDVYDLAYVKFDAYGRKLESLIADLLEAKSIPVHSVTYRVKKKDSARRKQAQLRQRDKPIDDVHDFLGLRVITYFADQVDQVAEIIEDEFAIDKKKSTDKRKALDPDRFGYVSLHYIAAMSDKRSGLVEWQQFDGAGFEIQLRSILQHSWAEIEHDLGYKSPTAIPQAIKRRFSRLAGMLELADDEFSGIRTALEAHAEQVDRTVKDGGNVPIDQDSLRALLEAGGIVRQADERIAGQYGAILEDEVTATYAASRANEMIQAGFLTTGEVSRAMAEQIDEVTAFANAWLENDDDDESPDRGFDGRFESFSPGISLFYFYMHVMIETGNEEFLQSSAFDDDPNRGQRMVTVHDEAITLFSRQ